MQKEQLKIIRYAKDVMLLADTENRFQPQAATSV